MVQFATTFSDEPIVVTLSRQLSWSHFVSLLPLKDSLQRAWTSGADFAISSRSGHQWLTAISSVRLARNRGCAWAYAVNAGAPMLAIARLTA